MPDADGQIRGISLSGRAGEAWERIFTGPRHAGKTDAMFRGLQLWCAQQKAIGPTPRLLVKRGYPEGIITCDEHAEGGPTVTMHPAMRVRLERWVDSQARFL